MFPGSLTKKMFPQTFLGIFSVKKGIISNKKSFIENFNNSIPELKKELNNNTTNIREYFYINHNNDILDKQQKKKLEVDLGKDGDILLLQEKNNEDNFFVAVVAKPEFLTNILEENSKLKESIEYYIPRNFASNKVKKKYSLNQISNIIGIINLGLIGDKIKKITKIEFEPNIESKESFLKKYKLLPEDRENFVYPQQLMIINERHSFSLETDKNNSKFNKFIQSNEKLIESNQLLNNLHLSNNSLITFNNNNKIIYIHNKNDLNIKIKKRDYLFNNLNCNKIDFDKNQLNKNNNDSSNKKIKGKNVKKLKILLQIKN